MKTIILGVLFFFAIQLPGQAPEFTVEASRDSVLMGNTIAVTFTIKNGNTSNFEAPAFKDFHIVGGPNQSSSMRIINGKTSQSKSYIYYIEPKEEGVSYIEPASVEVDGNFLETAPLEIKVAPNPDGIVQPPERKSNRELDSFFDGSFFDDPFFSQPFFEGLEPRIPKEESKPKKKRKYYKI